LAFDVPVSDVTDTDVSLSSAYSILGSQKLFPA